MERTQLTDKQILQLARGLNDVTIHSSPYLPMGQVWMCPELHWRILEILGLVPIAPERKTD